MEATVTISLTDEQQQQQQPHGKVGGRSSKLISTWSLVASLISLQVFAASCLSFYLLQQQMQNELSVLKEPDSIMEFTRCSTHWTAKIGSSSNIAWEDSQGQAFPGKCAEYNRSNQSLRIKKNGIYFVYVQVTFKQQVSEVSFFIKYDQEVRRQNSRGKSGHGSQSVYFGSLYRMREDTEIFINTTNTSFVHYGESMTFFGLFAV